MNDGICNSNKGYIKCPHCKDVFDIKPLEARVVTNTTNDGYILFSDIFTKCPRCSAMVNMSSVLRLQDDASAVLNRNTHNKLIQQICGNESCSKRKDSEIMSQFVETMSKISDKEINERLAYYCQRLLLIQTEAEYEAMKRMSGDGKTKKNIKVKYMAIIQQSLKDALADRGLTALPQEGDLNGGWQEAIVLLARTVGGIQSYAYATKKDEKISVVKDFGFAYQCSGIKAVLKAYPLEGVQLSAETKKVEESEEEAQNPHSETEELEEEEMVINDDEHIDESEAAMLAVEADNVNPSITEKAVNTPAKKRGRPRGTSTKAKNRRSIW